jgi:hypothetical protein
MTQPDTGGPATAGTRVYPRDSKLISDMARRFAVRLGRKVDNPEVVAALVAFGQKHEDEIAALVAA